MLEVFELGGKVLKDMIVGVKEVGEYMIGVMTHLPLEFILIFNEGAICIERHVDGSIHPS